MSVEQVSQQEMSRDVYSEIKASDDTPGELTSEEKQDLLEKYACDREQIEAETCDNLQNLRDIMQVFEESVELGREDMKKIQMILSIPKSGRDGIFWPGTSAVLQEFKTETWFSGTMQELISRWDELRIHFRWLNASQRRENQPEWGRDGLWGQGTFKFMLKNESVWERVEELNTALSSEPLQWSSDVPEDDIELQSQEEIVYNNGLSMTDEQFSAAKLEARESGENPNYTEFRTIVRELSRTEKIQLQEAVGANVDGAPGIGTYTHYLHSKIKDAWFSVQEAASLKKVTSENANQEISQIEATYEVDLWELPVDIKEGDFFYYDPDYGEMTIVDSESGEKSTLDIAEGIFDSIESSFESWNTELVFQTLAQIRRDSVKTNKYISELKAYILQNNEFDAAREIFCDENVETTPDGTIYTVDFKWDRALGREMKAIDLFWDQEFLLRWDGTYIRRFEPDGEYRTYEWNRLPVSSGTKVMIPSESKAQEIREQVALIERMNDIKDLVENNISELIESNKKEELLTYLDYDWISSSQKERVIRNIQETVFKEKLFSNMREMFTERSWEQYLFTSWNELLWTRLTAFDLFGDYKTLVSEGEEYHSITEKNYTSWGNRLSLHEWETLVEIKQDSQRTHEEYERIDEYPRLAWELWRWIQRNYVNNGNNSCGASVWDALTKFRIRWLPTSWRHGYAWEWFLDSRSDQFTKVAISHPSEAKPGWILVYSEWARLWTDMRKRYGHVEIKWENNQYYSYYHSPTPGGSASSRARWAQYKRDTGFIWYVYYPKQR